MIPIYKPSLTDLERSYLLDAYDSSWISSGKYIGKCEQFLKEYLDISYACLCSSGTAALHLALLALGVGKDDFVIVPNLTFGSTAFAVSYVGATPIFVDVDKDTWNIDVNEVRDICQQTAIKAVIPVHLMGNPCDMGKLLELREKYGFYIIEDACESLGATINGKQTGTFGDIGCFSFYGNKVVLSGEGGCVVTKDKKLLDKMFVLSHQAHCPEKRYWHEMVGYNYRITNLQAAILYGQLQRIGTILRKKRNVDSKYRELLNGKVGFQEILDGNTSSCWITAIKFNDEIGDIGDRLYKCGIDTRPMFYPLTNMPPYKQARFFHNAQDISDHTIMIPSYPELTQEEIEKIVSCINN